MADTLTRVTVADATKALTGLHADLGDSGFESAKAQYLKSVTIVDDEGNEVSPDDIEIVITGSKSADNGNSKQDHADLVETIRKTVAEEVRKSVASKRHRVIVGDSPVEKSFKPVMYGKARHFKGADAQEKAYRFGNWFAGVCGADWALDNCKKLGIRTKTTHVEGVNSLGGALVPDEFSADIINLKDEYGVARGAFRLEPMGSDTKHVPISLNGVNVVFTGEAQTLPTQELNWSTVTLTARKATALLYASNELNEDAAVNLGDWIAGEIARGFAKKEDDCGFNGDGTSAFGGIMGARPRIVQASGGAPSVGTFAGGFYKANTTTWGGITIAMITEFMSRLPSYARSGAAWYCHPAFADAVLGRLSVTLGGSAVMDFSDSLTRRAFGYPIVEVDVMPDVAANNIPVVLFGNLAQAGLFGDRRQMAITTTDTGAGTFETDRIAIRGIERFDINVHSAGSSTAAGPYLALCTGT